MYAIAKLLKRKAAQNDRTAKRPPVTHVLHTRPIPVWYYRRRADGLPTPPRQVSAPLPPRAPLPVSTPCRRHAARRDDPPGARPDVVGGRAGQGARLGTRRRAGRRGHDRRRQEAISRRRRGSQAE